MRGEVLERKREREVFEQILREARIRGFVFCRIFVGT